MSHEYHHICLRHGLCKSLARRLVTHNFSFQHIETTSHVDRGKT